MDDPMLDLFGQDEVHQSISAAIPVEPECRALISRIDLSHKIGCCQ